MILLLFTARKFLDTSHVMMISCEDGFGLFQDYSPLCSKIVESAPTHVVSHFLAYHFGMDQEDKCSLSNALFHQNLSLTFAEIPREFLTGFSCSCHINFGFKNGICQVPRNCQGNGDFVSFSGECYINR